MTSDGDLPDSVDANCMAAAMVTGFGGAEAMEADCGLDAESINDGAEPDDVEVPRDQAIALTTEAMDCGLGETILSEITADGAMEADDAACLFEKLDQDSLRDMLATEFMNETDAAEVEASANDAMFDSLLGAMGDCDLDLSTLGG